MLEEAFKQALDYWLTAEPNLRGMGNEGRDYSNKMLNIEMTKRLSRVIWLTMAF